MGQRDSTAVREKLSTFGNPVSSFPSVICSRLKQEGLEWIKIYGFGFYIPAHFALPFSICSNPVSKHNLVWKENVELGASFLHIQVQQLTLEGVFPLDAIQGALLEGPWDVCG